MALSEKKKQEILADFNTGDYNQRQLVEKHAVGKGTVHRLTKGLLSPKAESIEGSIYILRAGKTDNYKIGVASDIAHRVKNLQTAHYENLIVIYSIYIKNPYKAEGKIHKHLKEQNKHIVREWFNLSKRDIKIIKGLIDGN